MQIIYKLFDENFNIMALDTPQERLKHFIKQRFKSNSAFARKLGNSPQMLNKYLNQGFVFSTREKLEQLRNAGLNTTWYLNGVGEMDASETPQMRLRRFIESKFNSQKAFADAMGMTTQNLNQYLNLNRVFSNYEQISLLKKLGLNPEWYRDGTGSMEYVPHSEIDVKEVLKFKDFFATVTLYNQVAYANTSTVIPNLEDYANGTINTMTGVKGEAESFGAIRVSGNSMVNYGMTEGTIVVFNKELEPKSGNFVVAMLNGNLLVKQYIEKDGKIELHSADGLTLPLKENYDDECKIVGVVTYYYNKTI
jgi:SOS-response transcriptional repressor LexA